MSYDVTVGSVWINHTYNGAKEIQDVTGYNINNFNELPGCVVYMMVDDMLKAVVKNRCELEKRILQRYGSELCYGTYDSWLDFLTRIKNTCKEHQFAEVIIS